MSKIKIQEMLKYNKTFVDDQKYKRFSSVSQPQKKIVILSCMDTRLTELLPSALDIHNGDVKMIKNAGATVMHPFGSIARSVLVAVYEFGVDHIIVIGHYGCGMSQLDGREIVNKALERGISQEVIKTLKNAGIDANQWLSGFESPEIGVRESVLALKHHPLMPQDVKVHGWMMNPETGRVDILEIES